MRHFTCRCGAVVYFDNHTCATCGRRLAFEHQTLTMHAEVEPGDGLEFCAQRDSAIRCNWLADTPGGKCLSCRTSQIIPALSKPENGERWRKLEAAKRRLIYDLTRLSLPVDERRLKFVFKEDRRTNPDVPDDHVAIGHKDGVITINAAEADDVYREQMRQLMNEPYRTLLGHLRHESGHYYFRIVVTEALLPKARALFGDERADYAAALQRHYEQGPQENWPESYISSYASAHPAEDWAECWAHYLHIRAVLESAAENGIALPSDDHWQSKFIDLVLGINAVLRSMGLPDAYPFVITARVAEKIAFIHAAVGAINDPPSELATPAR